MAVGDAYVFPGFLTPVLTQLFFPKPPTTLLTCFCRVRGENTPERKVASTGDRTHNHQVMSPTRSPLSHPGGAWKRRDIEIETLRVRKTDIQKERQRDRQRDILKLVSFYHKGFACISCIQWHNTAFMIRNTFKYRHCVIHVQYSNVHYTGRYLEDTASM